MLEFQDLPLDILPVILGFLAKTNHLASAAKVNKTWNGFLTPSLYESISVFSWHKESKKAVRLLFATLASYPRLAEHVRRLEIRYFPKPIYHERRGERDLHDDTINGLLNCVNLLSCTWTRDGSLTDDILTTFASLPNLRDLEFNGHDGQYYDAKLLCRFSELQGISVIMPSPWVVRNIRDMAKVHGERLRSLTMICKASSAVTDGDLEDMAPTLVNLESFSLTGCPKVTERGVSAIVSSTDAGLKVLGLENVSTKFDMHRFSEHCTQIQALRSLASITLTISQHTPNPHAWTQSVIALLTHSPLSKFHIYCTYMTTAAGVTSGDFTPETPTPLASALAGFWTDLVAAHGRTLTRFSVMRMPISLASIREICTGCPNLDELFVVSNYRSVKELPGAVVGAKNLRTIHVNLPVEDVSAFDLPGSGEEEDETRAFLLPAEALEIAKGCGPSLTQFGCNTTVWKVGRKTKREVDGSVSAERVLLPYENPNIPEPFLVVRT